MGLDTGWWLGGIEGREWGCSDGWPEGGREGEDEGWD